MEIKLRLEEKKDYGKVEEITREAFWNVYSPGCNEHFIIHKIRDRKEFIKPLDYVAIYNEEIVGNIVYIEVKVGNSDKLLGFGPVSVLPEYQNKGIGSELINHTIKLAKEMGYKAILIYGDPEYYKRFGFETSKNYNITNKDKEYPAALLVLELYNNALSGITGIYDEGNIYDVNEEEFNEFEKKFEKKEKKFQETQTRFLELSNKTL